MSNESKTKKVISEVKDNEVAYVSKYAFTASSENPDDSTMYINTSHPCSAKRSRHFSIKTRRAGNVFKISVFDAYRVLFSKAFRREVAGMSDMNRVFGAVFYGGDNALCAVKPIQGWWLK